MHRGSGGGNENFVTYLVFAISSFLILICFRTLSAGFQVFLGPRKRGSEMFLYVCNIFMGSVCCGHTDILWVVEEVQGKGPLSTLHNFKGSDPCGMLRDGPDGHQGKGKLYVPLFSGAADVFLQHTDKGAIHSFNLA